MGKKKHSPMWHFEEDQERKLWPIFEADDAKPEIIYSDMHSKDILQITRTEKAKKRFLVFCKEIRPAINAAHVSELTIGEKRVIQLRALTNAEKLHDDLQKLDIIDNDELFLGWMAIISLKSNLKMSAEELQAKSKKSSKYIPLAAAVGRAMHFAGMKVPGYFAEFKHDDKDSVARIIKICIEAAGLKPTNNYDKLVKVASKAAKLQIRA